MRSEISNPPNQLVQEPEPVVLSIDIGGSNVKILNSAGGAIRKTRYGQGMTASQLVSAVNALAGGRVGQGP